jgi:D-amino-acid dehydrogenase
VNETLFDVIVLGAGSVGASSAAQIAGRGARVALIDSRKPGQQTSYGNAGIIDNAAFLPHPFPRNIATLLRYATGQTPHMHAHWGHVPSIAGWLWSYFKASSAGGIADSAARLAPLCQHAVSEHQKLAAAAGTLHLIRDTGWMMVTRTQPGMDGIRGDVELLNRYGISHEVLDEAGIAALEPHLKPGLRGGLWVKASSSTSDPGRLIASYAVLAEQRGAALIEADARGLFRSGQRWVVPTPTGAISAPKVVVALGPWAKEFLAGHGVDVPIVVKRGYHMHFSAEGNATLSRPVGDGDNGYCLTPMTGGYRMTTGAEFAPRDAAPTPVQVDRAEAQARTLFPLSSRLEAQPWLGARPNTPDGVPIICEAPGQPGMILAVGHGHWGLGLGAATGRLVADLVAGTTPLVDPAAFALRG